MRLDNHKTPPEWKKVEEFLFPKNSRSKKQNRKVLGNKTKIKKRLKQ